MDAKDKKKPGRKAGKDPKKTAVKASDDAVIEITISFKERVELLAELARGVLVEEVNDGEEKVYRTKPDVKALQQLNEMQKGKPQMTTKISMPTDFVPVAIIPGQSAPIIKK
jgi:hypothetical protein